MRLSTAGEVISLICASVNVVASRCAGGFAAGVSARTIGAGSSKARQQSNRLIFIGTTLDAYGIGGGDRPRRSRESFLEPITMTETVTLCNGTWLRLQRRGRWERSEERRVGKERRA